VQWRYTAGPLAAAGYEVVVVDLPGHGRSEPAANGPVTDLGEYADWLTRLLCLLDVERPFVVGCSIGGKIALDLAVRLGDGVAGVVAMAADAKNPHARESSLRRELEDSAAPSRSERTYLGTLAVIGADLGAERRALIATMHRREDPLVSTSDLIGWATHDLRGRLSEIVAPVRLVAGTDDLWLDVDDVAWAAAQIPGGTLTVLDGIGHYPMEEMADFPLVLGEWLAELSSPVPAA
jgi:pimeloyl-ACP methyl ester carboxylesterase